MNSVPLIPSAALFADDMLARRVGRMIRLDFMQSSVLVSRIAIHPDAVPDLIVALSDAAEQE